MAAGGHVQKSGVTQTPCPKPKMATSPLNAEKKNRNRRNDDKNQLDCKKKKELQFYST